jgi:hypothetical protein
MDTKIRIGKDSTLVFWLRRRKLEGGLWFLAGGEKWAVLRGGMTAMK